MFRFFEQLGRCNCCNPSTDILTAEDHQAFVTGAQERLDSNTDTHRSHSFRNGTKHSKLDSKSVAPQASSAEPQPPPPNSRTGVQENIGATLQDTHLSTGNNHTVSVDQQNVNSRSIGHINPELHLDRSTTRVAKQAEFQSLPSNSQAVEQVIGAILQDAHHFSIGGNARVVNIGQQHVNNRGTYGLDNLKEFVSFTAFHDSSAQDPGRCCHPETRKNVLHKMRTWMDDPNAPEQILWLHGPAGVGKSAIAQTISYSYGRDKIGASFFFFRSDPARNDGNRLFSSLAWRLASSIPVVKDRIVFSLEEDPDIPMKAIEIQFDQLIAQPVLTVSGGGSSASASTRVIVIDGLDECSDVKLQERILKVIGNAATSPRFPLRFIISSRPEPNIQDFFDQFQYPTLRIDLANVDNALRDIETYLTSEFTRIAVEQNLDLKTWPAQGIVDTLVSNSSGQFVYASTVMKYIGDKYESAVLQLDIILGLKPSNGKSPFSELDALYSEILQRQPDQNFLKEFLPVLAARSMLSGVEEFHKDDAMLLGLEETQLYRKLRGMCSILKFKPFLDVHHKSFLDFLDDSLRSGKYYVGEHFANRRYMQRITDILVKAASKVMEQPDSHGSDHFQPRFATITKEYSFKIELPLYDLEEILQPLLVIQENLLQLPNMSVPWKPRACGECWTFYIIDDLLLHLAYFQGRHQVQEPKYVGIRPPTAMEEKQDIPQLDLDTCLFSLLAHLRRVEFSLNVDTIGLVRALIHFDPTETAMKLRSMTDAQNLVELILYLNKKEYFKSWFGAAAHNATRLALAIFGRTPVLPQSLLLNNADLDMDQETYQGKAVKLWNCYGSIWRKCFDICMWGSLSHGNMGTLLGICSTQSGIVTVLALPEKASMVNEWRQSSNPSVSKIQQIFFEVANALQYIHSLGFALGEYFDETDVYVDSDNHAKVLCPGFCPNDLCEWQFDYEDYNQDDSTLESNIRLFALLFYNVLFDEDEKVNDLPQTRPSEPEIPDNVWELLQWCCVDNPEERPTIDQVVQEMESWIPLGQFTLNLI